jgi:hypothetical protein
MATAEARMRAIAANGDVMSSSNDLRAALASCSSGSSDAPRDWNHSTLVAIAPPSMKASASSTAVLVSPLKLNAKMAQIDSTSARPATVGLRPDASVVTAVTTKARSAARRA